MAKYIVAKAIKEKFHEHNKQITKDGLHAIDVKVSEFLEKAVLQFNGHHSRITAMLINLIKI